MDQTEGLHSAGRTSCKVFVQLPYAVQQVCSSQVRRYWLTTCITSAQDPVATNTSQLQREQFRVEGTSAQQAHNEGIRAQQPQPEVTAAQRHQLEETVAQQAQSKGIAAKQAQPGATAALQRNNEGTSNVRSNIATQDQAGEAQQVSSTHTAK